MSVVTNHQLFSHTYLARLQADPSHDEAAAPIGQGLRDWMPFCDSSSLQDLIDSWIGPVLDFLGFHGALADDAPHIHLLYARRGDETPVGGCYVVPPEQDLSDAIKRRLPIAQAVLALRQRGLRWGIVTLGARWRLVDARSLYRHGHFVGEGLNALTCSDDPVSLTLFNAFLYCSALTSDDGESRTPSAQGAVGHLGEAHGASAQGCLSPGPGGVGRHHPQPVEERYRAKAGG